MRSLAVPLSCFALCALPGGALQVAPTLEWESSADDLFELEDQEESDPALKMPERIHLASAKARALWQALDAAAKNVSAIQGTGWGHAGASLHREQDLPSGCSREPRAAARLLGTLRGAVLEFGEGLVDTVDREGMEQDLATAVQSGQGLHGLSTEPLGLRLMSASAKLTRRILRRMPEACNSIEQMQGGGQQVVACLQKELFLSRPCGRCIPKFLQHLNGDCQRTCSASLQAFSAKVQPRMQPLLGDAEAQSAISLEDSEAMQGKFVALGSEMSGLLNAYTPCVKCLHQRAASFAQCIQADDDFVKLFDSILGNAEGFLLREDRELDAGKDA